MSNNLQNNTNSIQKDNNQDTNVQPSLCLGCFEFFGNSHMENLCSKCYKNKQKNNTAFNINNANKTSNGIQNGSTDGITKEEKGEESKTNDLAKPSQADHTKCFKCNRKIGLLGFKCKCEYSYCKIHRLPEEHDCIYDYNTKEKEKLKIANPAIKASKLDRIAQQSRNFTN